MKLHAVETPDGAIICDENDWQLARVYPVHNRRGEQPVNALALARDMAAGPELVRILNREAIDAIKRATNQVYSVGLSLQLTQLIDAIEAALQAREGTT